MTGALRTRMAAWPRPLLLAALAAGILGQFVLASWVAGERQRLAVMLAVLVGFAVLAALEPRVAFCVPFFYLLLAFPESGRVTPVDLIMLLPPGVVAVSWLLNGEIARRAWRLLSAHRYKFAVIAFAALVVAGVGRAMLGGAGDGALQPARLALAPLVLFGLAVFRDRRDILRSIRLVVYLFVVYQLFNFFAVLAGVTIPTTAREVSTGGERLVGNSTGMYLSIALILMALHLAEEMRLLRRIGLAVLMSIATGLVLLSLARTTWAAFAAVVVLLLALAPSFRRGAMRFAAISAPIALLGLLLVPVLASEQVETVRDRIERPSGPTQRDQSLAWREEAWALMLDRWEESPVTGRGFGQSVTFVTNAGYTQTVTNDPHNGFIYILVATGALGLAAFALVQLGFLRMVLTALRTSGAARQLGLWSLSAWIIIMANIGFGVVLGSKALLAGFWVFLSIPVALAALPERGQTADEEDGEGADSPALVQGRIPAPRPGLAGLR